MESTQLQNKLQRLSWFRMLSFLSAAGAFYLLFSGNQLWPLPLALAMLLLFLWLIRYYDQQKNKLTIRKALLKINETEEQICGGSTSPYPGAAEWNSSHHPYSYDLDLFGPASLFSYLNRTSSGLGSTALAQALLQPDTTLILPRQEAIRELTPLLSFRQELQAHGTINQPGPEELNKLQDWLQAPPVFKKALPFYLLLLFPAAAVLLTLLYFILDQPILKGLAGILFVANLGITLSFIKQITRTISVSSQISKALQAFGGQLGLLETTTFRSKLLLQLQQNLQTSGLAASASIRQLFSLLSQMDYIFNVFISPWLNGFLLFHPILLFRLDRWKARNKDQVMTWLNTVGETEALGCFGNLAFNHPDFVVPSLSATPDLEAKDLGHPLISAEKRINNDIRFHEQAFIILTGSNMSGKSTFLRTLGINLVLARAGSAVCASSFHFYPFPIYVSMRITDSLQDSESFFYAELKRLHTIILKIETGEPCFVLLDEILRGTNSNDKHNGTIGLIRKMAAHRVTGIIATHDLTVSELSAEYPDYLSNQCFESEIIDGNLYFDYKIKPGVCTRLSASYLMQKMGIIE